MLDQPECLLRLHTQRHSQHWTESFLLLGVGDLGGGSRGVDYRFPAPGGGALGILAVSECPSWPQPPPPQL
eukprot:2274528-Amphidinium_carterae.1